MLLSTPLAFCSMGVATDCSRVEASAPVYVVVTFTSGGTMSGNCATGSFDIATTPAMTVTMEITMATMGRRTKKLSSMAQLAPLGAGGAGAGAAGAAGLGAGVAPGAFFGLASTGAAEAEGVGAASGVPASGGGA